MAKHHPDLIFCRKQPGVGNYLAREDLLCFASSTTDNDEDGNRQTDPLLCVVVRKKIVPLYLHVCMPFSAHFYVLLTQFTFSLYFAVS